MKEQFTLPENGFYNIQDCFVTRLYIPSSGIDYFDPINYRTERYSCNIKFGKNTLEFWVYENNKLIQALASKGTELEFDPKQSDGFIKYYKIKSGFKDVSGWVMITVFGKNIAAFSMYYAQGKDIYMFELPLD